MEQVRLALIEVRSQLDQAIALLEPTPPVDEKTPRLLCWGAKVSREFREGVFWIEQELKLNADYLMACMAFETGVTFSPSKKNPASSATGLIQFMRATITGMVKNIPPVGRIVRSHDDLKNMSAVKQLSLVYYYFKQFGTDHSGWDLADTYMAILLPTMIGKPLDAEMAWGQGAHNVNRGLDTDKDGKVTKREAYKKVLAMYELGRQQENLA